MRENAEKSRRAADKEKKSNKGERGKEKDIKLELG